MQLPSKAASCLPCTSMRDKEGSHLESGARIFAERSVGVRFLKRLRSHFLCSKAAPVRVCHSCGGEFEQIQFLLGHASVKTTERYTGCKQNLKEAAMIAREFQRQRMSREKVCRS